jgi:hypothetical protein
MAPGVIVVAERENEPESGVAPGPGREVDPSRLPSDVAVRLAALTAAVDAVTQLGDGAGVDLDGPAAAAIAAVVGQAASRLGVTQARMLPMVEVDGLWSIEARSLGAWVARRLVLSARAAHAQVRLGRELRDHLPLTAAAAAAGEITVEHAQILARAATNTEQRREVLADPDQPCNEAFLVHQARLLPVDQFRAVVRNWAAAADPDADDRGYIEACDREHLTVDQLPDGYHLTGFLSVEHGQALCTALKAITPVPAVGDDRTSAQRRAQALGDLAKLVIEHGLVGTARATRPRIGVLVGHETLQNLVDRALTAEEGRTLPGLAPGLTPQTLANAPRFEDGAPVPRMLLDKLACDGELNRYIFGPRSEILDVGRAERTFTGARRSAIIARDRHCRYPGCDAPPAISECHHVKHWGRDGRETSVANGILLCWHHHEHVHRRGIEMHRRRAQWVFTDSGGREIADALNEAEDEAC